MRFGEKITLYIFRPIYRTFVERLLWWFLARVKVFFLAEIGPQISECLAKIDNVERRLQQLEQLAEPMRRAETNSAAQWDALEQLLLALIRQPESRVLDANWNVAIDREASLSSAIEPNRVHAASNIR